MKKIIFIRHGKAEDQNHDLSDFERSLTTKGKKEIHNVAMRLHEKQPSIDLFITSPAFRAIETAFIIASEFNVRHCDINISENLYYRTNPAILINYLQMIDNEKMNIAIIGAGGTARAAAGALDGKVDAVDVLLRSSNRVAAMSQAAPNVKIRALEMDAPLSSYDLIIQTTPVGAYDQYVEKLHDARGLLLECLYKPWPTPLAARYAQLGGRVISGGQLLVEQALFQIELFSGNSFDFATMRRELLLHISAG